MAASAYVSRAGCLSLDVGALKPERLAHVRFLYLCPKHDVQKQKCLEKACPVLARSCRSGMSAHASLTGVKQRTFAHCETFSV
jgi:hypothetical protein